LTIEIVHLGDFWDVEKMEPNKYEIIKLIEKNSKFYKRAYKYFGAARLVYEDIIWKNEEAQDFGKLNIETHSLIDEIFKGLELSENLGKVRHLFGSAYTPSGWVEYTDTILEDIDKIYYIKGDIGTGKSTLLEKIYNAAVTRGYNVEIHHTPLIPEKIETVIIKDLSIALTIMDAGKEENYKEIDLDKYLDKDIVSRYKEDIEEDKRIFKQLIDIAVSNIREAKKNHDLIETYYVPNMNFDEIVKVREELIERILKYER